MKVIDHIRCSGLSRPMKCAGSLFFENLPPQEENEAAREGTAAGEWLERILTNTLTPGLTHARNGYAFDDDMKFYTAPIAEAINKNCASTSLVACEQRIDWQTRSGIWIKGTYDISFIDREGKLHIEDLKYGWKLVEVKDNWQLIGYAIGEVIRRGQAFDRIVFKIHQPRPHHEDGPERTHEITYEQLLEYKEQIESRMDKIAKGFAQLVTGDQCKYCPAAGSACTAFNHTFFAGVDHVLNHFQQDSIDDKELSFQYDLISRVGDVLKIKQDSLKQLMINRIREGAIVPNYMLEESYGDRKWKKEISPAVIKTLTGIDIIEPPTMLSPAKAEKLGVPKDLVSTFVDRHFVGMKPVRKDSSKIADKIFNKGK